MSIRFVYPEFLYAFVLIAIPIIIHLFNFRRFKKVAFTNVRFLKELKEETNSRSKLKHLLTLLARILAISFLVLAFAQPFVPKNKNAVISSNKAISVFVDNSFSMESVGKEGILLQQAQTKAKEIALAYKPSDRFQLLTCDFAATQQRMLSREEFLEQLQQVKVSPSTKSISEIVLRQKEALVNSGAKELQSYIISDFQKSDFDLSSLKNDSTLNVFLINLESKTTNNLYIDSCWLLSPVVQLNHPVELIVRVKNSGQADAENVPVKLTVNEVQKSLTSISVPAGRSVETKLSYTITQPGWQVNTVSITDYPVVFDDNYYLSFKVNKNLTVTAINQQENSQYLERLFGKDSLFILKNNSVNQIDYSLLQQSAVVILNNLKEISSGLAAELGRFVNGGGTLVVFPDSSIELSSYNFFLNSVNADGFSAIIKGDDKVDRIELQSDVYKNVFPKVPDNMDVPLVSQHYDVPVSSNSNREMLLKLQSGGSLLSRYLTGKGRVYVFTIPLNNSFSNFVDHYLFAPTVYNIALFSQRQQQLSYTIGRDNSFDVDQTTAGGEEVFHLVNKLRSFDIIPDYRNNNGKISIYFAGQIRQSGNYSLNLSNQPISTVSMNYSNTESDLSCFNTEDLKLQLEKFDLSNYKTLNAIEGSITQKLSELSEGSRYWKMCIIFALLFLAIEVMFLRFLK